MDEVPADLQTHENRRSTGKRALVQPPTLPTYTGVRNPGSAQVQLLKSATTRVLKCPVVHEVVHKRKLVAPRMTLSQISQNESPASARLFVMELGGLEPPTSWVRSRRSPN